MKRFLNYRRYCISTVKNIEKAIEQKLEFTQLRHPSKVPDLPINEIASFGQEVGIDAKKINYLERLALVNLDGEEALRTLRSSIQFAEKITAINTDNIKPLYTVLENNPLHLRTDLVIEGNCRDDILKNAKIIEEDYFISPPGNIPIKA